jgi:hypothetical protein
MNSTVKTVALTITALSLFTIAMIEVSGISEKALFNKFKDDSEPSYDSKKEEALDKKIKAMPQTTFAISDTMIELGKITEGEKRTAVYSIKNTGTNPLLISNIVTSCGCTAPTYPKQPMLPGDSAAIELVFNSAGKEGEIRKSAMVKCNSVDAPFPIAFKAFVAKQK